MQDEIITYQYTDGIGVIKSSNISGKHLIPPDPNNKEWQQYIAWKNAGGVPKPKPRNRALDLKNGEAIAQRRFLEKLKKDPLKALVDREESKKRAYSTYHV